MKARYVAKLLNVKAFTLICLWLDNEYAAWAKRFDVLEVKHTPNGILQSVKVILSNNRVVNITVASLEASNERRRSKSVQVSSKSHGA